ncbi:MAG: FMN-binding protein [Rhodothalassiaceae bacterium]
MTEPGKAQDVGRVHLRMHALLLVLLGVFGFVPPLAAETITPPDSFLAEAFDGAPPKPAALWLTPPIRERIERIMGHRLPVLRLRYWRKGARTAWILEEIGKEQPITAGFVVEAGALREVAVLIYRESRGGEIRYPYFRDQFVGARLSADLALDADIDGISGATLSVHAMQRMARLALYLDGVVRGEAAQ